MIRELENIAKQYRQVWGERERNFIVDQDGLLNETDDGGASIVCENIDFDGNNALMARLLNFAYELARKPDMEVLET